MFLCGRSGSWHGRWHPVVRGGRPVPRRGLQGPEGQDAAPHRERSVGPLWDYHEIHRRFRPWTAASRRPMPTDYSTTYRETKPRREDPNAKPPPRIDAVPSLPGPKITARPVTSPLRLSAHTAAQQRHLACRQLNEPRDHRPPWQTNRFRRFKSPGQSRRAVLPFASCGVAVPRRLGKCLIGLTWAKDGSPIHRIFVCILCVFFFFWRKCFLPFGRDRPTAPNWLNRFRLDVKLPCRGT